MNCVDCNKESDTVFYREVYPCSTCGDLTIVEYNACKYCGTVWKTANGHPMDPAKTKIKDFAEILDNKDFKDFFDYIGKHDNEIAASMDQCVHRCLKCNTVAFEIAEGTYKCASCGFEWEAV